MRYNSSWFAKAILFGCWAIVSSHSFAVDVDKTELLASLVSDDVPIEEIREHGEDILPVLVELYQEADADLEKVRIAWVFWKLGWASEEVEQVLLNDLDSQSQGVRLWAQYGIAKATRSSAVVSKLVKTMQYDSNPLFRDKAACALASDFIHIDQTQRLTLLEGLVDGLGSDNRQVRDISLKALRIQTGQDKGFNIDSDEAARSQVIVQWESWLDEYRNNL